MYPGGPKTPWKMGPPVRYKAPASLLPVSGPSKEPLTPLSQYALPREHSMDEHRDLP